MFAMCELVYATQLDELLGPNQSSSLSAEGTKAQNQKTLPFKERSYYKNFQESLRRPYPSI